MLIDTKRIVTKTQLRENLTDILMLVERGREMMVSDRGRIKVKISPIKKKVNRKSEVDKFMAELKELRKSLSAKNPSFDSTQALREVRRES